MKKQYISFFWGGLLGLYFFSETAGQSLSAERNAVVHSKLRVATTHDADATVPAKALIGIQYLDGLGRPLQNIGYQQSPGQKDVVSSAVTYDKYGRVNQAILTAPVTTGTGMYQTNPLGLAQSFYGDTHPFTQVTVHDNSPLNRVRQQYGVGQAWRDASRNISTYDETAGTDVRYYYLDAGNNIVLSGTYPANSLFKIRTVDEQGHTSISYNDLQGRLVQKQTQDTIGYITTYYIYDGSSRIKAIIQPEGFELNQGISYNSTEWNNWVFFYLYNSRGLLIEKKVPGAGAEHLVYDKWDRLVWQQTALQRESGKWTFRKYDAYNRLIMSGEKSESRNRGQLQTEADGWLGDRFESRVSGGEVYYSYSNSYPQIFDANDIREVFYFSTYDYWRPSGTEFDAINAYHAQHTASTGFVTGGRMRNTENGNWLVHVNYYDNKNRIIQTYTQNLYGHIERTDYQFNYVGEPTEIKYLLRDASNNATIQLERFEYDHAGRKTAYKLGINALGETIASYEYDEIGRLKTKRFYPERQYQQASTPDYINRPPSPSSNVQDMATKAVTLNPGTMIDAAAVNTYVAQIGFGDSTQTVQGLQTINLDYHIRGNVNCINCTANQPALNASQNDFFASKLDFESTGWFDGNIGKQSWLNKRYNTLRSYTYNYDSAKRLLTSTFSSPNTVENYNLSIGAYDKNGNIQSLNRNGLKGESYGIIDQLTYTYTGNRLMKVEDAISESYNGDFVNNNIGTDDYEYYSDGSLKKDLNKQITTITYDSYLKKVKQVDFSNGKWLKFFYDANGKLLKRQSSDNETWEYTSKTIFKDGQLYQISQEEGRVVKVNNIFLPEFEYRDIWGNLRTTFRDSLAPPIDNIYLHPVTSQFTDYDMLGMELKTGQNGSNNFKYQNQERINDFGIGIDLFKFRPSDYQIGRFWQIDPLAEKYAYNSVYAFQENKFGLGIELEGAELLTGFVKWANSKWESFKKSIPDIKIESNVSIGPQLGFEVQSPLISSQAEVKLASFDIAKHSVETKKGEVVEKTTLGYTQKIKEGNKPEKTIELDGANVETSVGFGLSFGSLGISREEGIRQDIKICGNCQGSSNERKFSKNTVSYNTGSIETTTESKYGIRVGQSTDINLFKIDIKFIIGYEIKIGINN